MVSLVLLLIAAARAACTFEAPPDARFGVAARAPYVRVVLELWVAGAPPGWAGAILDQLDQRSVPAMIVVPLDAPKEDVAALLARVRKGPHAIALALRQDELPTDRKSLRALKDRVKAVSDETGRVKTVVSTARSRNAEALLGKAGFRSYIQVDAPSGAVPRMAGIFEAQPSTRIVLPPGPYEDGCGADPRVGPFSPPAADRAAVAMVRASRVHGTPIVRVALSGAGGRDTDAAVLGRWLDEVVSASGAEVVTAEQARAAVLKGFMHPESVPDVPPDAGGRIVGLEQVQTAAASLTEAGTVPRTLPGDLNPTEAFAAFVALLGGRVEGASVRLGALKGPATEAVTSLPGPTPVSREAVIGLAKQLGERMPTEIPAALPVDGRLLTASELLLAFASAVRGDDPAMTAPVTVPEPNQRGLGWGESTLP